MPPRHASYTCTIVEATRATTAETPFLPNIDNAGLLLNNPLKSALRESESIFPGHSICCVLSFGSGAQAPGAGSDSAYRCQFLVSLVPILPGDTWSGLIPKFTQDVKPSTAAMETFNAVCAAEGCYREWRARKRFRGITGRAKGKHWEAACRIGENIGTCT